MTILNSESGNTLIKQKLKNNDIFSVGRVGITEITTSYFHDKGLSIPQGWMHALIKQAGVYGDCIDEFHNEYINAIKTSDVNIFWNINNLIEFQTHIFNTYSPTSIKTENRAVEPFYFNYPWSEELKNKTVLVIHPFTDTINTQFKHRDKIWSNDKILPQFDLKLYKPVQSIGDYTQRHTSWLESLNYMKQGIANIQFDIALLGCGAYGMPLCNFIKTTLNKTAIYIGGGLQLLFGIRGKRWDDQDASKFYNSSWTRPNIKETPVDYQVVEGGSYW